MNKMAKRPPIQKILDDFVLLDCRLGDHPKIGAAIAWWQGDYLATLCGTGILSDISSACELLRRREQQARECLLNKAYHLVPNAEDEIGYYESSSPPSFRAMRSLMIVPILTGDTPVGTLTVASTDPFFFHQAHLGRAQLLAALIAYWQYELVGAVRRVTSASTLLGQALRTVREELGLSQANLAAQSGESRTALSRWEAGAQPPTHGPLYRWCESLGLLSPRTAAIISVTDITPELLRWLKEDPQRLQQMPPAQFERLIAERLDRMGYDVTLTTPTFRKDGGIDLSTFEWINGRLTISARHA
jgi:transcriptional regulator with XRE-family HTH domain